MGKPTFVYDIETLVNCFTYVGININTDEIVTFVVWKGRNDFEELIQHLSEVKGLIGFNSLNFDYPVLHNLIKNQDRFSRYNTDKLARTIYQIAQNTIQKEWSEIRDPIIPQLDLFRVHHFDNKAKMTSLKKLEIAMQFENVEDMPHHHTKEVETEEELERILSYNLNDVKATKLFFEKTKDKIELRKGLKKRYGLDCLNYSDSKIGEHLMLKLYCKNTGQKVEDVKKLRTYRNGLKFSECIPSYISFDTPEFNKMLEDLRVIEIEKMIKGAFEYSFEYKGFKFDMGIGGIHGANKSGVYEVDNEHIMIDSDVN